ncbi:trypsin-like peptidase domain-containing protein [bacterium]|nr:trypsin-like peptidase domain-containing protein [bacterium]
MTNGSYFDEDNNQTNVTKKPDSMNRLKRVVITSLFAVICVAAGFMLGTRRETPKPVNMPQTDYHYTPPSPYSGPLVDEEGNSPFVRVAETVKPVVVNITAEKTLEDYPSIPFDIFDWGPLFGQPQHERRRRPLITSGGSGIIIDREGYILTNNHLITDADEITVKLADQSEHSARIIGTDPETDIALIKIDSPVSEEMVARFGDSDKIRIGEWAIAVGNPFGLDWTVTVGVISARGRSNLQLGGEIGPAYQDFIQTDASINFGNSGGPLINIRGEVIGINTAINAQGQGIGFAIPAKLAFKVLEQLKASGEVHRGYLGIYPTELSEIKREALGIDEDIMGIFVDVVEEGTPADKGGLKGGEVITEIEGRPIREVKDFRFLIADYPPGTFVEMTVLHKGKLKEMKFKLGDRTEYINRAESPKMKSEQYWLGIEVASTESPEGRRLGVKGIKGVVVVSVIRGSPAEGLMETGDVIVEIGGIEIESMDDYDRAEEELKKREKAIPFWVNRNGRRTFIPIRPG